MVTPTLPKGKELQTQPKRPSSQATISHEKATTIHEQIVVLQEHTTMLQEQPTKLLKHIVALHEAPKNPSSCYSWIEAGKVLPIHLALLFFELKGEKVKNNKWK